MDKYNSYEPLSGHIIRVNDQDTIDDVKMKCGHSCYHPNTTIFFEFHGIELVKSIYYTEDGEFDIIYAIIPETVNDKQLREKEQEKARKYEEKLADSRRKTEEKQLQEAIKKLKKKGYTVEQKQNTNRTSS